MLVMSFRYASAFTFDTGANSQSAVVTIPPLVTRNVRLYLYRIENNGGEADKAMGSQARMREKRWREGTNKDIRVITCIRPTFVFTPPNIRASIGSLTSSIKLDQSRN